MISSYYQELEQSKDGNISAKGINDFIQSVENNGGYYIARYEASYGEDGKPNSKISTGEPAILETTSKTEGMLWNWVTQEQAANASQNMYNTASFTSDLVNSYAWDTAIAFIQTFSDKKDYSMQDGKSLNSILSNTGTNNDIQLNINDMAGGVRELTTEYCSYVWEQDQKLRANTIRGGSYYYDNVYVSSREGWISGKSNDGLGFRTIIYINN